MTATEQPLVRFDPADERGIGVLAMCDVAGRNVMSDRFVHDLVKALGAAEAAADLKVLVMTGLDDIFSSGASVDMLSGLARGEVMPTDIILPRLVFGIPVPVIAAMEGHAIGGGLALGLSADIVIIARESRYGASFMNMGFTPGMGMTKLLEHVMSPALAAEMLYAAEPKKGSYFEGKSGFNAIVPRAEVRQRALAIAARIAEKPRASLALLKRALSLPRREAFERTHTIESLMHSISFADPHVLSRIQEYHDQ